MNIHCSTMDCTARLGQWKVGPSALPLPGELLGCYSRLVIWTSQLSWKLPVDKGKRCHWSMQIVRVCDGDSWTLPFEREAQMPRGQLG